MNKREGLFLISFVVIIGINLFVYLNPQKIFEFFGYGKTMLIINTIYLLDYLYGGIIVVLIIYFSVLWRKAYVANRKSKGSESYDKSGK